MIYQHSPRVAFVSQWFPPEVDGPPKWIPQALHDAGLDVGVLTGVPHYPSGKALPGYRATGWVREQRSGLPVVRVPEYPSHDRSAIRRIGTFASYAASASVLGMGSLRHADVCLVYSSPATAAWPAMVARARFGIPYVLMIQDLWPESLYATGMVTQSALTRVPARALDRFVSRSYMDASHIVTISPGMRTELLARGVPPAKLSLVYNWVDETLIHPEPANGALRSLIGVGPSEVVMLFAGNMGEAQGLSAWLHAMAVVSHELPHFHLVLLGQGTQRAALAKEVAAAGLTERVHLLDPVPVAAVGRLAADADLELVTLTDQPLFHFTMPSKTQAALARGKPVMVSAPGDAAELVRTAEAGWVAEPDNPLSMADAMRRVCELGPDERAKLGQNGLRYYSSRMSSAVGGAALSEVTRRAAATNKR